jgi:hypothetical protein
MRFSQRRYRGVADLYRYALAGGGKSMKRIFSSADTSRVGLIRSLLDAADIPYEVRNEALSRTAAGFPFEAQLWVRDEDYEDATRLLTESHPE